MVTRTDAAGDHAASVLQGLEPVAVDALLLERADHPLDHSVRVRTVGRDELLLQSAALDQRGVATIGEH